MRLLKLSQWKVTTEFGIVMLEVSFIYCQPTANSCSGQLRPLAENMLPTPFCSQSLCNSIIPQLFCDLPTHSEEDSMLSIPVTSSAEHVFSHTEKPFGEQQQGRALLQ